ncbi:MAG TPA: hypothetical protein VKV15_27865, partial [Bryobacteraceae bacterium]|nr:hypothetical protein [Bryobacteraceae bacterium]
REDKSQGERWRTVASFPIHVADCKPGGEAAPPPESETPAKTEASAQAAPQPRKPPSLKKPGETP